MIKFRTLSGILLGEHRRNSWYLRDSKASSTLISLQRCVPVVHRSSRHNIFGLRSRQVGCRSRNRGDSWPVKGKGISGEWDDKNTGVKLLITLFEETVLKKMPNIIQYNITFKQTRIILNKADQVKPEELMRVQGALIWNISPLMSSAEPPIMYSTSLWSLPYEAGAPIRLLYAQERAFLRDLRSAINKRVEHKIASARRFAVSSHQFYKAKSSYLSFGK